MRRATFLPLTRLCHSRSFHSTKARHDNHTNVDVVPLAFAKFEPPQKAHSYPPLVVMHGLFGSKQNWKSLAKAMALRLETDVFTLDLRNHGESPHHHTHTYNAMADDVSAFMAEHRLDQAVVMGHSMGGKVAMALALRQLSFVHSLVVVDMSPVSAGLSSEFATFVEAMKVADAAGCTKQSMADEILRDGVPDIANRHFLLTNLKRDPATGIYRFRVPLDTLSDSLAELGEFPFDSARHTYHGPTLFIAGEKSEYVVPEKNGEVIRTFFPNSRITVVEEAGHWVHSQKPDEFLRVVTDFVKAGRA